MKENDKLYSRRRIKLPNFRVLRKINSFKIILLIMFNTILVCLILFFRTAYPVFKASCETAAASKGNKIINNEVTKVMQKYNYNSLIRIEKDTNGRITLIETNSSMVNEIVSQIVFNIQKEFDKIPRIAVFINMGSVTGISVLKNLDPKFEVELESAGNLNTRIRTDFQAVGINQTHHKLFLEIDAIVGILTPLDTFSKEIHSDVLLTEAIIVGEVPESFYDLDGIEDLEKTYNFVE